MSFFGKLGKLVMDVVETPVAILKDVATLGGSLTDEKKPYTQQKLEDIGDDWKEMKQSLDEE